MKEMEKEEELDPPVWWDVSVGLGSCSFCVIYTLSCDPLYHSHKSPTLCPLLPYSHTHPNFFLGLSPQYSAVACGAEGREGRVEEGGVKG